MLQQRKIVAGESLCSRFVISCNNSLAAKLKTLQREGPNRGCPRSQPMRHTPPPGTPQESRLEHCIASGSYHGHLDSLVVLSLLLFAEGFS